jgi:hypothetical protein
LGRYLQVAAPVERVGVEQRCLLDQLVKECFGVHLLGCPVREVFFGAKSWQLQPAHLEVRLLKRLGNVDSVRNAGAIVVGADDDLADSQFDQCLGVFDPPVAAAVGVGGGEQTESACRGHIFLTLNDQ